MKMNTAPQQIRYLSNRVGAWVRSRLGTAVLMDRRERAARLVEEAIELAQAEGVSEVSIRNIAKRVYSREVGEVKQEVGGVGVCLLAYCYATDLDFVALTKREVDRIEKVPMEKTQEKHDAKVKAGTAMERR